MAIPAEKIETPLTPPLKIEKGISPLRSAAGSGIVAICEFRGQRILENELADKATGVKRKWIRLEVSLEFLDNSRQCKVILPAPFGETVIQELPFKKGQPVIAHFTDLQTEKGNLSGRISHVEAFAD